jgi:hypothetical protein
MRGISVLAKELSASQEGNCSMYLVIKLKTVEKNHTLTVTGIWLQFCMEQLKMKVKLSLQKPLKHMGSRCMAPHSPNQ